MKVLVIYQDPEAAISGGFHRHQLDEYAAVVVARAGVQVHQERVSEESFLVVIKEDASE